MNWITLNGLKLDLNGVRLILGGSVAPTVVTPPERIVTPARYSRIASLAYDPRTIALPYAPRVVYATYDNEGAIL